METLTYNNKEIADQLKRNQEIIKFLQDRMRNYKQTRSIVLLSEACSIIEIYSDIIKLTADKGVI